MRTLTATLFASVDGVVESPHLWQLDSFDDQVGEAMDAMISATDTVLLGRVSYEEWAGYWPTATDEFGEFINPVRKLVASRTLTGDLAWQNSALLEGDLEDAVSDLKHSEGGDIAVCGSISVVRQLLFAGLLDRLTLIVHPVVAGAGGHLFRPEDPMTRLHLHAVERTEKGNVVVVYGPADELKVTTASRSVHPTSVVGPLRHPLTTGGRRPAPAGRTTEPRRAPCAYRPGPSSRSPSPSSPSPC